MWQAEGASKDASDSQQGLGHSHAKKIWVEGREREKALTCPIYVRLKPKELDSMRETKQKYYSPAPNCINLYN